MRVNGIAMGAVMETAKKTTANQEYNKILQVIGLTTPSNTSALTYYNIQSRQARNKTSELFLAVSALISSLEAPAALTRKYRGGSKLK